MKTITKGKNMNNFKKVGLTALAGSLAAISSVNAAEMSVSGASVLTYTSEDGSEVPETDISTALAEKATREPAKADSPIFLKLFMFFPFVIVFIYE